MSFEDIQARWYHGHDELTDGCSLCQAEYREAFELAQRAIGEEL